MGAKGVLRQKQQIIREYRMSNLTHTDVRHANKKAHLCSGHVRFMHNKLFQQRMRSSWWGKTD